jgi:hypothetical protein
VSFLKTSFNTICNVLIFGGCLFIALDAVYYQKEATKRESSRCEQIKKISELLEQNKTDPDAVDYYCKELDRVSQIQESYRWKFGSSVSK